MKDDEARKTKTDKDIEAKERRYKIFELLKEDSENYSRLDLANEFGVHENTIKNDIRWFNETYGDKLIIVQNNKDNSRRKHYELTDKSFQIPDDNTLLTTTERATLGKVIHLLGGLRNAEWFDFAHEAKVGISNKLNMIRGGKTLVSYDENSLLQGAKKWLSTIFGLIKDEKVFSMDYKEFNGQRSTVVGSPLLLKEYNKRWFLIANVGKKVLKNADRMPSKPLRDTGFEVFPLDRIESIGATSDATVDFDKAGFDPDTFFDDVVGVTHWKDRETGVMNPLMEVRFRVSKESSRYIETKPLHKTQKKISSNPDGSMTFEIKVRKNYELTQLLLSYGESLTVLSPLELVEEMKEKAAAMLRNYSKQGGCGA